MKRFLISGVLAPTLLLSLLIALSPAYLAFAADTASHPHGPKQTLRMHATKPHTNPPQMSNLMVYVNGRFYSTNQTQHRPLKMKVGTRMLLVARWNGGPLNKTGYWVSLEDGAHTLARCNIGSACQFVELHKTPVNGRTYHARLHDAKGHMADSKNMISVDWVA